jgi:oligo-1,6-glucosidase
MTITTNPWWKEAVFYQIYPASFQDSNGDGVGDLPGVLSRIDYIKDLGADAIWICPMYDSPQHDMGYDISDYEKVYPLYGTVQDMENIIAACHERDMKVILDLVINHTSDDHAWFKESRSSKNSPKRDWYFWRPARYDADGNRMPPNNWASFFGGSAWQWDDQSQEYYLHLFLPQQPDLNWENAETRKAIYETSMHYWLRKGIDGFRVDAINVYSKDPELADAAVLDPLSKYQVPMHLANGPRMHEFVGEMHEVYSQYGATTVGELGATEGRDAILSYVSAAAKQLDMVFLFDIVMVDTGGGLSTRLDGKHKWTLPEFAKAVKSTQEILEDSDGWVTTYLENHDWSRSISRWGSDASEEHRVLSAKMLATLQSSLSGTMFIYQGQEIGMVNAPKDWPLEDYKDNATLSYYQEVKERTRGDPAALQRVMAGIQHLARDHSRIPISWDTSPNAGFSDEEAKPWMRIHDNYKLVCVENQLSDKDSVLSFWTRIVAFRKQYANSLVHGIFKPVQDSDSNVFIYEKRGKKQTALIALNFSALKQVLHVPVEKSSLVLSTYGDAAEGSLRPFEGRIWIR